MAGKSWIDVSYDLINNTEVTSSAMSQLRVTAA